MTEATLFQTRYDREACQIGVVHIGYGAFHRAHQAVYIDDMMEATGDLRWGIAAVNLRATDEGMFSEAANAGDDGYIALLADNGKYLTVNRDSQGQPLVATADKIGNWQKFKWLELPPAEDTTGQVVRDIALRPWAGSGDLIGTIASSDGVEFGLTGPVGSGIKRGGANSYRMLTAYTDSVEPLQEIPPEPPGPFFGSPMPIPTNGDHNLPTSAPDNRLYASDYDIGGEGISYHDTGAVNLGEAYRPFEGVDVESTNEEHTAVGFFEDEEWLDYTVDVAQAGELHHNL